MSKAEPVSTVGSHPDKDTSSAMKISMKKSSTARDALLFAALSAGGYLLVMGGALAIVTLARNGLGCAVNEGAPVPCQLLGVDIGEQLYALGMVVMLGAMAVPLVLLAIAGALLVAAGAWLWSRFVRGRA